MTPAATGHVVLAPDKFKGCLTAAQVADALAAGLHDVRPDVATVTVPVADGGDGTVAAAVSAGYALRTVDAAGPTGSPSRAAYAVSGHRAVVELAAVVGLDQLPGGRREPLGASTYGLGLVLGDALRTGCRDIVLGLGGSASTDGGAGMLQAMGLRLLDGDGRQLPPHPGALDRVAALDTTALTALLGGATITVATDVGHPLLGPRGAAAVFGPQKGAGPAELAVLEERLSRWSRVVTAHTGRDDTAVAGSGAAGGTGYGAIALLGARVRPGVELVLELVGFAGRLPGARLVITGEGSLDEQSLAGKAPVGVAREAAGSGAPVLAVAGRSTVSADQLRAAGFAAAYPLSDLEPNPRRSIEQASRLLREVGRRLATEWLP